MLVLTRRTNESIMIGDDVRIVVLDVRGDVVRVGIEAPRSVQVHRAEVYAEVVAQASAAAGADTTLDLQELEQAPRARQRSGLRPANVASQYRVPQPAAPVDSVDVTALEPHEAMSGNRRR